MDSRELNILLVEDDEIDVMNVQRVFKKLDMNPELFVAGDGLSAMEHLQLQAPERLPDLILLDLNMPRMNGLDFLASLREDERLRRIPVVVLTTSGSEEDIRSAHRFNVAGYIVKPMAFKPFLDKMSKLFAFWQACAFP